MLCGKLLLLLLGCSMALSHREDSTAELFRHIFSIMEQQLESRELFDFEDDDVRQELQEMFDEYGIDSRLLLEDGVLSSIWTVVAGGDTRKTFTTANFGFQINCYQGKSFRAFRTAFYAFKKYNEYGCYCGGGQSQGSPLDATDSCCKIHDACYGKAMAKYDLKDGCETYTTKYSTTCCRSQKETKCNDPGPSAGRALCECDQAMARCVSKTLGTYSDKLKNARSRRACRVKGKKTTRRTLLGAVASCVGIRRLKGGPTTYPGQGACSPKRATKPRAGDKRGWGWG